MCNIDIQKSNNNPWLDIASYQIDDAFRFKGREEDVEKFLKRVNYNTMSVLYANSGIGKTSFINAGIIPALANTNYLPIHVVIPNEVFANGSIKTWLYDRLFFLEQENVNKGTNSKYHWRFSTNEKITESETSIWWLLHTAKIIEGDFGKAFLPLIIFDQFEEMFLKAQKAGAETLLNDFFGVVQELAREAMPSKIEQELDKIAEQNGRFVSVENVHEYKVIFSLRKEYLSDFDYWTNDRFVVPELYRNRMYLLPLTREQATRVITEQPNPENEGECIDTLNEITDDILNKIDERNNDEVEPLMLSVLCSRLYDEARSKGLKQLTKQDVESKNMDTLISKFYVDTVSSVIADIKKLSEFEEQMVDKDNHRNKIKSSRILGGEFDKEYEIIKDGKTVKTSYKKELENKHIIRVERYNNENYVELIHDRLAEVVAERIKHSKKRKENAQRIQDELNVLSISGRQLIDNANDFGEYQTIHKRNVNRNPNRNPQVESYISLSAFLNRDMKKQGKLIPPTSLSISSLLEEDVYDNAYSIIRFTQTDGEGVRTRDGIYQFKVRYKDNRIAEIYFYGQEIEQKIYTQGGFHGIRFEYSPQSQDGSYTETRYFLDDTEKYTETIDGYAIVKYHFNQYGLLDEVRYFNTEGKSCDHVDGNHGFVSAFDIDGFEIKRTFVSLTPQGKITSLIDENERLEPTKIVNGIYGHTFKRNGKGLITEETNINNEGNPCYDLDYYCKIKYEYDDKDRIILEAFCDEHGNLMIGNDGYAVIKTDFNDITNTSEDSYYGLEKDKCVKTNDGYWKLYNKYDKCNRLVSLCFNDYDNCPSTRADGVHEIKFSFNDNGQIISIRTYDKRKRQIAGSWVDYNKQGTRIIRMGNLSSTGEKKIIEVHGCMALGFVEKDNGDSIITFLDEYNKPQVYQSENFLLKGVFGLKEMYDEKGRPILNQFFDHQGKRTASESSGVWELDISYDDNNKAQTYIFQKKDGIEYKLSFTRRVIYLNDYGDLIRHVFFNDNGDKALGPEGVYSIIISYTPDNLVKTTKFLDKNGNLMNNSGGYAIEIEERILINDEWKTLKRFFKNAKNELINNEDGVLITRFFYYDNGHIVEKVSMDENENPCINKDGFSKVRYTYDAKDRLIQEEFFDMNKQLCNNNKGYSIKRIEYDDKERAIFEISYDSIGSPIVIEKGTYGIKQFYDDRGRIIKKQYFDEDLNRTSRNNFGEYEVIFEYVEKDMGHETIIRSIGEDGNLQVNNEGWAIKKIGYDNEGFKIYVKTIDESNFPICTYNECYGYEIKYEDNHKKYTKKYLQPNNKLGKGPNGYSVVRGEFDEYGRVVLEISLYYNEDEKPTLLPNGTYGNEIRYRYYEKKDKLFKKIQTNLGLDGNKCVDKEGICEIHLYFDLEGKIVGEHFYDNSGRLVSDEMGYFSYSHTYEGPKERQREIIRGDGRSLNPFAIKQRSLIKDEKGRVLEELYFDEQRKPVIDENGNYGIGYIYLDDSHERIICCLDSKRNPHQCKYGYAYQKNVLDKNNSIVRFHRYDINMKPLKGYECRITYCNDENQTEIHSFFDYNGNECNNESGYFKMISYNDIHGNRQNYYFDIEGNVVTLISQYEPAPVETCGVVDLEMKVFIETEIARRKILTRIEKDGKYGYADELGNEIIPCIWSWAVTFYHENLAAVMDSNGNWGFIDKSGKVIIPCQWKEALSFYEGLSAVRNVNGEWGYIDKANNVIIPFQWKSASIFMEGLAYVKDSRNHYGYIDKTGMIVIPCEWKRAECFSEDLAAVQDDNNKWGYIDKMGNLVIKCQWDWAEKFQGGSAQVRDAKRKYWHIDKTGKVIEEN